MTTDRLPDDGLTVGQTPRNRMWPSYKVAPIDTFGRVDCSSCRYDLRSTINVQGFFGFRRKLARTKTQQSTDKASDHNGRTVFLWALVLNTRVSTGVVSTSSYHLSSIYSLHFLTICTNFPFSPPPPPPTEYAAPFGLVGHTHRPPIDNEGKYCIYLSPPLPIFSIDPPSLNL